MARWIALLEHYHAARDDVLRRLGRTADARHAYIQALELTEDGPERRLLERRLGETAAGPPE